MSHASISIELLRAGKHVACEKPLCLTEDELSGIVRDYAASDRRPILMVGFNRRFAPMSVQLKQFLSPIHEPLAINYRVQWKNVWTDPVWNSVIPDFTGNGSLMSWTDDGSQTGGLALQRFYRVVIP